tara:strand:- start:71 stop:382 length:312 start_codon:yes stop_codon:yes gene_type:complete
MSNYKLDVSWFASHDSDKVTLSGRNTFTVTATGNYSQKVLSKLHSIGKPYVIIEGEEVVEAPKPKPVKKSKKKKIKVDEPTEESPTEEAAVNTESDLSEEGES